MQTVDSLYRRLNVTAVDVVADVDPLVHSRHVDLRLNASLFGEVRRSLLIAFVDEVVQHQMVQVTSNRCQRARSGIKRTASTKWRGNPGIRDKLTYSLTW